MESTAATSESKPPVNTIVFYSPLTIGHLISAVELGKLILRRYGRCYSITVLLTTGSVELPSITAYIDSISRSFPSFSFLRFPPLDAAASPSTAKVSYVATLFDFIRRHSAANFRRALLEISDSGATVTAVVMDVFCSSALPICRELGIPSYHFWASGAAALAAFLSFPKIFDEYEGISFKDQPGLTIELPAGLPPILATDMPSSILDRADPAFDEMRFFCSTLSKSDGILVNTFEELEQHAVDTLKNDTTIVAPPVYCIGPLTAQPETELVTHGDYLTWLDEQANESVVYLCFGSRGSFSIEQIEEIAVGLERSGHRFLWVVKAPVSGQMRHQLLTTDTKVELTSVLPTGFLERTRDRGRVVEGWALQSEVLKKGSVGGFVTHCGWNSVLEALSSGVPLAAWPLYAEQHLNRNMLAELMKMAIPVKQRDGDRFVSADEVEKAVRELMEGEKGREVREKSLKMRKAAMEALADSGSSTRNLASLVETWKI